MVLLPIIIRYEGFSSSESLNVFYQVQRRMVEIFSSHQAEVNALKRDLHMSRLALTQAGLKADQILSQEEHPEQFTDGRSGVESNTSEVITRSYLIRSLKNMHSYLQVSWEAVDDSEARPTLWVPDHAASSCMGCHTQFWFGRRKHHCRYLWVVLTWSLERSHDSIVLVLIN